MVSGRVVKTGISTSSYCLPAAFAEETEEAEEAEEDAEEEAGRGAVSAALSLAVALAAFPLLFLSPARSPRLTSGILALKRISAPSLRPIQLVCISRVFSGQSMLSKRSSSSA